MKKIITLSIYLFLIVFKSFAQPVDNPYKTKYGVTSHWTDLIKWTDVYICTSYGITTANSGVVNSTAIATLINTVSNAGGGVIYFPAGTYNFAESIILKSGVVLRGVNTTGNATSSGFDPSSNFVFPKNQWKRIGEDFTISSNNMGLVNIDVDKAHILFTGSGWKLCTGSTSEWEKYATILDQNIIIMNVRVNNTGVPQPPVFNANGWCWRFASHINLYTKGNSVVANCRAGDNSTIDNYGDFEHLNHYGIVINRQKIAIDTIAYGTGLNFNYGLYAYPIDADPLEDPTLFYSGNEIRDCWVKTTMRVKIMGSGTGLIVENNVTEDNSGKICIWDPAGKVTGGGGNQTTFENRGMDVSGYNVTVRNNVVKCYRCNIGTAGGYPSVDGEGILTQECCGGTPNKDYLFENNTLQGDAQYIGLWKVRDVDNVIIRNNNLNGKDIYAMANTNGATYRLNNLIIEGNTGVDQIKVDGTKGGASCSSFIRNNTGTGRIIYPCHVTLSNNTGFTPDPCIPVDVNNEPAIQMVTSRDTIIHSCDPVTIKFEAQVLCGSFNSVEFWNNLNGIKLGNGTQNGSKYTFNLVLGAGAALYNVNAIGKWSGSDKYTNLITVDKRCYVLNNTPIVVSITNPQQNIVKLTGESLNVEATATTTAGSITKVEFYLNTTKVGEDLTAPYTYTITNLQAGNQTLKVKAFSNNGDTEESSGILIMVKTYTSVEITPSTVNVEKGSTQQFTAVALDQNNEELPLNYQPIFSWNISTGGNINSTGLFTAQLNGGPYTLLATGIVNGISKQGSALINVIAPSIDFTGIISHVTEYNGTNGSIDITVTKGTSPYIYSWSNGKSTQDILNIPAGTYYITVSDAAARTKIDTFIVNQPLTDVFISATPIVGCSPLAVNFTANAYGFDNAHLFQESGGVISIEAEKYHSISQRQDAVNWTVGTTNAGFTGTGYLATPAYATGGVYTTAAETKYLVDVHTAGAYTIYFRRWSKGSSYNSAFLGVNAGGGLTIDNVTTLPLNSWQWYKHTATITLAAGIDTLKLRRKEAEYGIDKIILSLDNSYVPSGTGYAESSKGVQYAWTFGDGKTSISQNPTNTFSSAGIYKVKLIATCGSKIAYDSLSIDALCTEIGDVSANEIKIIPNPATDFVSIKNIEIGSKIELVTISGISIKEINSTTKEEILDIRKLTDGIYFLIISNKGNSKILKLIKD